jgi:hypothetical protein
VSFITRSNRSAVASVGPLQERHPLGRAAGGKVDAIATVPSIAKLLNQSEPMSSGSGGSLCHLVATLPRRPAKPKAPVSTALAVWGKRRR